MGKIALGRHVGVLVLAATAFAACIPVTVNVTFPQEKQTDRGEWVKK